MVSHQQSFWDHMVMWATWITRPWSDLMVHLSSLKTLGLISSMLRKWDRRARKIMVSLCRGLLKAIHQRTSSSHLLIKMLQALKILVESNKICSIWLITMATLNIWLHGSHSGRNSSIKLADLILTNWLSSQLVSSTLSLLTSLIHFPSSTKCVDLATYLPNTMVVCMITQNPPFVSLFLS